MSLKNDQPKGDDIFSNVNGTVEDGSRKAIDMFGDGAREINAIVSRSEASRFLGCKTDLLDAETADKIESAAKLCESELKPKGIWSIFDIDFAENAIQAEGTRLSLTGNAIHRHLEGCDSICLMAVTLGMESERALRRESALGMTGAMIYDACASSLVEQAANVLSGDIREQMKSEGLICTGRFSPGFSDLPLEVQPSLLDSLDAYKKLGITTTPTFMMTPSKSITAIIGIK